MNGDVLSFTDVFDMTPSAVLWDIKWQTKGACATVDWSFTPTCR
jgi:ribonuclease I